MFSHETVACVQYIPKDGVPLRFNISRTKDGDSVRFQAVCTSIVRTTLEQCIASLLESCDREDSKTESELAMDEWRDAAAERAHQSGYAYACGYRD